MQIEDFTEGWEPLHAGLEGTALSIDGINPWMHAANWRRVQAAQIVVPHPSLPQERHRACVYEIHSNEKTIRFAATELSNGVWGFYVQRQPVA